MLKKASAFVQMVIVTDAGSSRFSYTGDNNLWIADQALVGFGSIARYRPLK